MAQDSAQDLIQTYCVDCHNLEDYSGGIAFDLMDMNQLTRDHETWEMAINKLRGRLMPPTGAMQPSQVEVDTLVSSLETSIDSSLEERHIGHVPVQRLNRTEFATIVEDLLAVEVDPV